MAATREAGFGAEVKRRIILGTYALSSGYYDAYYGQAQKVRTLIVARLRRRVRARPTCWSRPTTPTTAFPIGDKVDDPLAMYLNDLAHDPDEPRGHRGAVGAVRARRRRRSACRSGCRSWRPRWARP